MIIFLIIPILSILFALLGIILNKKYLLSILICIESILLNLIVLNLFLSFFTITLHTQNFSLYLLTLSAIEASVGVALLTLITRNFNSNNITPLNLLKS
uniref:NADH-ubiquinone oxidoreductase chain 4L n=1 Tax=Ophiomastix mixta TaxID=2705303 RepID=A0A6C0FGF8_9ECHI|nr:NADH dehydrogenase subunit 4L [Ophiomastix mixta]QHT54183.1 NADH dehydrogenase subunit 4L [Ophiomastix mixta]